jgi:N-acetylmuramoyl-L-alanine amidase
MNPDLNIPATYDRAALLTAVLAFQHGISVPKGVVKHQRWTGKHCPRVLIDKPNGWDDFLSAVKAHYDDLENVPAPRIAFRHQEDA